MARALPAAKLIAVLRNPVERAYSHYQHMVRTQREKLSFTQALEQEGQRVDAVVDRVIAGEAEAVRCYRDYSYKSRGRYAEQLERWLGHYDRAQLLVLRSEDLFGRPEFVCDQIYGFLGLAAWKQPAYDNANPGQYSPADAVVLAGLAEYFKPHNQRLYDLIGMDMDWERVQY
jgi:hypothetical protein